MLQRYTKATNVAANRDTEAFKPDAGWLEQQLQVSALQGQRGLLWFGVSSVLCPGHTGSLLLGSPKRDVSDEALLSAEGDISIIDLRHNAMAIDECA